MRLFLVGRQFSDEARLILCENYMFTQVGLPWDLDSWPEDFRVRGAVRYEKRTTDLLAPSYCTLQIHIDSSRAPKSFLMLVGHQQLTYFCNWCALTLCSPDIVTHQDLFFRDFEHTLYYDQVQPPISRKPRWKKKILILIGSLWFGFKFVELEGFGDETASALQAIRDYPWTSYDDFLNTVHVCHNESVQLRDQGALDRGLVKSEEACYLIEAIEVARHCQSADTTWVGDMCSSRRAAELSRLRMLLTEYHTVALSRVLVRNVQELCSSQRDEGLYQTTLRLAQHALLSATEAWYYSVRNEGLVKIGAQRDLCMTSVSACIILLESALGMKLWAKGMSSSLFTIEEEMGPHRSGAALSELHGMMSTIRARYGECKLELRIKKFDILEADAERPEEEEVDDWDPHTVSSPINSFSSVQ